MTLRCISTMRTLSITWSLPATPSMLMTCSGFSTAARAICWARSASARLATWPERIRLPFMASTWTRAPGTMRLMVWATAEGSWSTRMSSDRMRRPAASKNTASVEPFFRPMMKMRRGVRSMASATAGLVTSTSRTSTGSSTIADLPLGRVRDWVAAPPARLTRTTADWPATPAARAGAAAGAPWAAAASGARRPAPKAARAIRIRGVMAWRPR